MPLPLLLPPLASSLRLGVGRCTDSSSSPSLSSPDCIDSKSTNDSIGGKADTESKGDTGAAAAANSAQRHRQQLAHQRLQKLHLEHRHGERCRTRRQKAPASTAERNHCMRCGWTKARPRSSRSSDRGRRVATKQRQGSRARRRRHRERRHAPSRRSSSRRRRSCSRHSRHSSRSSRRRRWSCLHARKGRSRRGSWLLLERCCCCWWRVRRVGHRSARSGSGGGSGRGQ